MDGAAPTYELPVAAIRCPVCGSKRITRLFNKVNVSSDLAKRTDAIVEPAYTQAMAVRDANKDALAQGRIAPALGVPINRLAATLGSLGVGAVPLQNGGAVALPRPPNANFMPFHHQGPHPAPDSMRDLQYRIQRS